MISESEDSLSFYENRLRHTSLSVLSIPLELGSDARGLAGAPQYLFDQGLLRMIKSLGLQVEEKKVIVSPKAPGPSIGQAKNLPQIAAVATKSAAAATRMGNRGDFILSLGGDHSIAAGSISGASRTHKEIGVIWIDAHPDAHTTETSLSGNVHGMPAAALMGFGDALLTGVGGSQPKIKPENFLYIGLKDFDQAEIDFIRREKVEAVTMLDA
jgi:arginase